MEIAVCFKITSDYDELTSSEWEQFNNMDSPDISYIRRILGCFDEAALENALLLKNQLKAEGTDAHISGYTLNPGYSDHILKTLPPIGIDDVFVIQAKGCFDFAPDETAHILSDAIKTQCIPDILITGSQAPPGNSGIVPAFIANELGLPVYDQFVSLSYSQTKFHISIETPLGIDEYIPELPFLCTAGNTEKSFLRVATLREKLKYSSWEPVHINYNTAPPAFAVSLHHKKSDRKSQMLSLSETIESLRQSLNKASDFCKEI